MAINMYDNPAEAKFIDTYVPIDFDNIWKFNALASDQLDKTTKKLEEFKTKYNTLDTPYVKDAEAFAGLMAQPTQTLNSITTSGDLGSPEVQAQISSTINSMPYGDLAKLTSAAKQGWEMRGKLDPNRLNTFANEQFKTHSTLEKGIPTWSTAVKSQADSEILMPYFSQLKPDEVEKLMSDKTGTLTTKTLKEAKAEPIITRLTEAMKSNQQMYTNYDEAMTLGRYSDDTTFEDYVVLQAKALVPQFLQNGQSIDIDKQAAERARKEKQEKDFMTYVSQIHGSAATESKQRQSVLNPEVSKIYNDPEYNTLVSKLGTATTDTEYTAIDNKLKQYRIKLNAAMTSVNKENRAVLDKALHSNEGGFENDFVNPNIQEKTENYIRPYVIKLNPHMVGKYLNEKSDGEDYVQTYDKDAEKIGDPGFTLKPRPLTLEHYAKINLNRGSSSQVTPVSKTNDTPAWIKLAKKLEDKSFGSFVYVPDAGDASGTNVALSTGNVDIKSYGTAQFTRKQLTDQGFTNDEIKAIEGQIKTAEDKTYENNSNSKGTVAQNLIRPFNVVRVKEDKDSDGDVIQIRTAINVFSDPTNNVQFNQWYKKAYGAQTNKYAQENPIN